MQKKALKKDSQTLVKKKPQVLDVLQRIDSADFAVLAGADATRFHRFAVERRTLTAPRGVELLAERIVHDGAHSLALVRDADRDGAQRQAIHKIRRAVDWIDNPNPVVRLLKLRDRRHRRIDARFDALLTKQPMRREGGADVLKPHEGQLNELAAHSWT